MQVKARLATLDTHRMQRCPIVSKTAREAMNSKQPEAEGKGRKGKAAVMEIGTKVLDGKTPKPTKKPL